MAMANGMMRFGGGMAAALAVASMAAPAEARDWRGRGGWGHDRHRGDRIDGGDVLLGALLAGGVIAIASAASRNNRERDVYRDAPPPPPRPQADFDDVGYTDDGYADVPHGPYGRPASGGIASGAADAATDACATAAEAEGRGFARVAQVQSIDAVDPDDRGGWYVAGTLGLRDGYQGGSTRSYRFRCMMPGDGQPNVRIDGI
ncbi:hypothetical protein ACNI3Q_09990 [Sphingomonas sp. FW199]